MPHPDPAISHPPGVPRTTASDTPDTIGAVVQLLRAHETRLTALEARGPDLAAEVARLTAALAAANERVTAYAAANDRLRAAEARAKEAEARVAELTKPGPVTEQEIHEAADRSASLDRKSVV